MNYSPQDRLPKLSLMQRDNIEDIGSYGKMSFKDLKRLDTYLLGDIFGKNCVIWKGECKRDYTTCSFTNKTGTRKVSVRQLLYHNYIDDFKENLNIKNVCSNKKCCNVNHLYRELLDLDSIRSH